MRASVKLVPCVLLLAGLLAGPVRAQSQQSDFDARVIVINGCAVSATDMDFGSPAPGTTSVNSTATVTVRCSSPSIYLVTMDRGDNAAAAQRRMLGTTGDFVNYSLFRNAARTQDWGSTIFTGRLGIGPAGVPVDYTVYGRIPVLNTATLQGSYLDTVTVTVNF